MVEEQHVVRGNDLVRVLPHVVGLWIGLGGAQNLTAGRALVHGDQTVRDFYIFWWICWDLGVINKVNR